jgi:hypothetical protein
VAYSRMALFAFAYLLACAFAGVWPALDLRSLNKYFSRTSVASLPLADKPADALYRFPRTSQLIYASGFITDFIVSHAAGA